MGIGIGIVIGIVHGKTVTELLTSLLTCPQTCPLGLSECVATPVLLPRPSRPVDSVLSLVREAEARILCSLFVGTKFSVFRLCLQVWTFDQVADLR